MPTMKEQGYVRPKDDFFETPKVATCTLLNNINIPEDVTLWECSCVDCMTEYFNGTKWKSISEYKKGESVLCYTEDGSGILLKPEAYHKIKTNEDMYLYKGKHLNMCLSKDHTVIYFHRRNFNLQRDTMANIYEAYKRDHMGFRGHIPLTFKNTGYIDVNEWLLRLAVACNADGTYRGVNKHTGFEIYEIRLKKLRKVKRLLKILSHLDINWGLTPFIDKDNEGIHYSFKVESPLGNKRFPVNWIYLKDNLKKIFLDELIYWDGSTSDGTKKYFSAKKSDIDIVQMIAHSIGISVHITIDSSIRKGRKNNLCYTLMFRNTNHCSLNKRAGSHFYFIKPLDGYKYCFTVPTGMLILRRENQIFITGNCGMGAISKILEKVHGKDKVLSTELDPNRYGIGGVDFLKDAEKYKPNGKFWLVTNPPFQIANSFVRQGFKLGAERIIFLLRFNYLESGKVREDILNNGHLLRVLLMKERLQMFPYGWTGKKGSATQNHAWFIWDKNYQAPVPSEVVVRRVSLKEGKYYAMINGIDLND